jgi:hypothetical protein
MQCTEDLSDLELQTVGVSSSTSAGTTQQVGPSPRRSLSATVPAFNR